jgi:hypothetical protein
VVRVTDEAVARWLWHRDQLLRGVTHALSNRVAAASVAAWLVESGPTAPAVAAITFREEIDRLEGLLRLLRQLPVRADAAPEPVVPVDVVRSAVALHAHRPDLPDLPCAIETDGEAQAGWADPDALCHAIAIALAAAASAVGATGLRVRIDADDAVVGIGVQAEGLATARDGAADDGHAGIADVDAIDWLLGRHGGRGLARPGGCRVEVPTLAAVRASR